MSAPSATDASDGEEDYTEDSGLSFKLQITVRSCAGAEMHVTGAGRTPESRSPRLPPIFDVPPNSATSGSGDSKDGGKQRSRYHSGCIGTSPGRSDTKSSTKQNKRNIQKKDRTPSHETAIDNSQNTIDHDSVAKYLLNHPEFLEAYVMENSSPEIIEKWLLRKLKLNAAQGMRQQRKSSLSRYRMYIDSNKSLLLQNLLDTIRMYPTLDQVLWEIGYRAGLSVGTDGFNVFRLKKSDPDLLDVLVGAPTEKPVRSVSIAKVSMPVINEIVTKGQPMRLSKDSTNKKYPRDLICSNKDAQHVMYLPITMPEEDSAAVLELWRMNSKFYEEDEEIATSYLMWGAITLHYVHLYTDMLKQRKLQDYLLDVAQSIFQDMGSLEDLVEKIMLFAQELVQADRASLFLVDSKTKELYATVFDVGVEGVVSPTGSGPVRARTPRDEIRFPIGTGIAGYVAQTGEVLNIKDAYKDGRFNSTVDLKTGYRTKTILCMPIFIRNTIIGVVQMVNKLEDTFSASDEESFKMFATYCGLALHHSKLYNKIKRSEQKYKVALEVLSYHNTCSEEEVQTMQDDIKTSTIKQDDFTFNPFDISEYERAIGSVHMFTDLFGLTDFDKKSLTRFVLTVKKNYRKLPYHNWAHGFAVANTMYNILKRHDRIFSRNESLALFIGSLCHDLDHRGKSNKFMLESESPLAAMYSTSTMEHHHFNQTVIILQQEGHNIFAQLSNSDYKQLLGYLKHCILATDLAAFFPNRDKLSSLLRNEQYDWDIKEHRSLALAICMTAADLSASAKPWKIQTETVKVIFQEFYDQGDLERAAGREPIAMMDRNRQEEQAASQVGFISGICLPCYELLYQIIPKTKPLYHMCLSNLQRWKRTDEQIREYMHAHKDYGYEIVIFLEKLIAQVEPDDFEKDEVFNKSNNSPHTFKQNDSSGHSKIPISKSTVNKMNNLGYKHKLKGGKIEKFDNQAVGSKRFDHVNVSDTTEIKNASFLTVARCEILSPVPLPVGQSLIQKIDDKIKNADSVADSNTSNNSNVDGIMKRDRENSTCSLPSVKEEDCDEAKFDDDDDNDCVFNDRN